MHPQAYCELDSSLTGEQVKKSGVQELQHETAAFQSVDGD
jgi:hypothetical protein